VVIDFLKHWFDPAELTPPAESSELVARYVASAVEGAATDSSLALTRTVQGLPRFREPAVDQLDDLDGALAELADGDPTALLRMPTPLRAAVENRIGDDVLSTGAIVDLRVALHRRALAEVGITTPEIARRWLERAQQFTRLIDSRARAAGVLGAWSARSHAYDAAVELAVEVLDGPTAEGRRWLPVIAQALESAGRVGSAIELLERLTSVEDPGARVEDMLMSRNSLASAYRSAGRLAEAIELFEATLADSERVLGADHPDTVARRADAKRWRSLSEAT
jgi:tetratricopeptide (TPR) repeat protein